MNRRRRRLAKRRRRKRREQLLYNAALAQLAADYDYFDTFEDASEADDNATLWFITFF